MSQYDQKLLVKWEERVSIYWLLNIQKNMDPAAKDDYDKYISIIVNRIESRYPELFECVGYGEKAITKETTDEVDNILEMYRTMQKVAVYYSHDEYLPLTGELKIQFPGFDANTPQHLTYYNFIQRYNQELMPRTTEAFSCSLGMYRNMYKLYKQILEDRKDNYNLGYPLLYLSDIEHILHVFKKVSQHDEIGFRCEDNKKFKLDKRIQNN